MTTTHSASAAWAGSLAALAVPSLSGAQHAPKTARFGSNFEEGTQQSYLMQTRSDVPCPDAATLSTRLDAVAQRLQISLPAKAAAASPNTPAGTQ